MIINISPLFLAYHLSTSITKKETLYTFWGSHGVGAFLFQRPLVPVAVCMEDTEKLKAAIH